jgi:Fe-S-cluster containining protein
MGPLHHERLYPDAQVVRVRFVILGEILEFCIEYVPGMAGLADLADGLYWLCDQTTEIVIRSIESRGGTIACRKGCALCCRHLIPVSVAEAASLGRYLLEDRHANGSCIERFRAAAGRVSREFEKFKGQVDIEGMDFSQLSDGLNAWYEQAGIDCPMLVDESCCVYESRPMICRQWGVVGNSQQCMNGAMVAVRKIAQPISYSDILRQVGVRLGLFGNETVLLPFALDWYQANRPKCDRQVKTERLVTEFLNVLDRKTQGAIKIL